MGARLEFAGQDGTIVDLLPAWTDYHSESGYAQAMAGSSSAVGAAPDVTTVELFSQVVDGAAVAISSVGNAEFSLSLRFTSNTDSSGLTDVEQQLAAVCDQPDTLTYAHPDGVSEATVWDVQLAQLAAQWDGTAELRLVRYYTLTLTCWPWPRSEDLWTAPAVPAPPTTVTDVTLDAPTTTSGWTATSTTSGATVSMDSGMVVGVVTAVSKTMGWIELKRTGSFALSTSPYVKVTGALFTNGESSMRFFINDIEVFPASLIMASSTINGAQSYTAFLPVPAGVTTMTSLRVRGNKKSGTNPNNVFSLKVWVDEVHRTNASPFGTDVRTQDRTITIPGSKAAQAQVTVTATDSSGNPISLGPQVLLYTTSNPDVVSADISKFRTAAGPARTADSTMLSGAYTLLSYGGNTTDYYQIPFPQLPPGTYVLLGKLASSTGVAAAATIQWLAFSDPAIGMGALTGASVNITAPATQQIVPLGMATLPTVRVDNPGAINEDINVTVLAGSIKLDTLFLCKIDDGDLSLIDTGTPSSTASPVALIYNAPGFSGDDTPVYELTVQDSSLGDLGDFDAAARVASWAAHQFTPGPCRILAVATSPSAFGAGANHLDVQVSCYPRWTAFAGEAS